MTFQCMELSKILRIKLTSYAFDVELITLDLIHRWDMDVESVHIKRVVALVIWCHTQRNAYGVARLCFIDAEPVKCQSMISR